MRSHPIAELRSARLSAAAAVSSCEAPEQGHRLPKEEYERQQCESAEHAASEGAMYYDPESTVIWKQYLIGPVPRWRRLLWWFFPPSHRKMREIMRRRSNTMWRDATGS
jgi:hypothetical protein